MLCCKMATGAPAFLLKSVFLTLDGADATLYLLSKECHSRFFVRQRDTKVAKCSRSVVWYWCQISVSVQMWCCLRGVLSFACCNILIVSTYNSLIIDPNCRFDLFATLWIEWLNWFHVALVLSVSNYLVTLDVNILTLQRYQINRKANTLTDS